MKNPGNYYEETKNISFCQNFMSGLAMKNDLLYIFGGFYTTFTNEIITAKINLIENTITSISTIKALNYPKERLHASLNAFDHRAILFGGYNKEDFFNDLWIYYSKTRIWEAVEMKGNLPSKRNSHAAGIDGYALVIWGGEGKTGLRSDIYIFNILKKAWKEINPIAQGPSPRKGACGILIFPKFYILGGMTYSELLKEVWEYEFNTNSYTQLASAPQNFYYANCQLYEGHIYILGATSNENVGLNKIYYYVIKSNVWKEDYSNRRRDYYSQSVSLLFPDYLLEFSGISGVEEVNTHITIYNKNNSILFQSNQQESAFASSSTYILSNLIYFSGGLHRFNIPYSNERADAKFKYIPMESITKDAKIALYCAPGSYLSQDGKCKYCPMSSYAEGLGNKKCYLCPPGTISNNYGLASSRQCYPCSEGTFNENYGQKECRICPHGFYCPVGSVKPKSYKLSYSSISTQPKPYEEPSIGKIVYDSFIKYCSVSLSCVFFILLLVPVIRKKINLLDLYINSHDNKIDHPLVLKKTKIGGTFTLIFIGIGIFILGFNVINFLLRNVTENKSLQPLSTLENKIKDFESSIFIIATFEPYLDICAINNVCQDEIKVVSLNILKGKIEFSCKKIGDACVIDFLCENCEIDTTSQLVFKLNEVYSFSTTIKIAISSESSIPESKSIIYKTIVSDPNTVFIGSSPSQFFFTLTPSVFYSSIFKFPSQSTGYHISELSPPSSGSMHTIDDLVTETGLMAIIKLEKSAFGMFTFRDYKQSIFVISGVIIGSIAGVFQVIGFLMSSIESIINFFEAKIEKKDFFLKILDNRLKMQLTNQYIEDSKDSSETPHVSSILENQHLNS